MSKRECLKRVQHQPPNTLFVLGRNAENIRNGRKTNTVSVLSSSTTSTNGSTRHHPQVESIQRLASQGTIKPATGVISSQKGTELVKPSNIAPNSSPTSKLSTFDTVSCPPPPVFFAVDKCVNPNVLVDWKKLPPRWTGKKPAWQVFCTKMITKLCHNNNSLTPYFKEPVDPIKLGIPDYLEKVETPMDLETIRKKIQHKQYVHPDEFVKDIRLIIDNILFYYEDGSAMQRQAKRFEAMFNASWIEFPGIDAPDMTENKPKQRKPRETSIDKSSSGNLKRRAQESTNQLSESPRSTSDSSSGVFKKPYPPGHQKMKQLKPSPDKFKPLTSIKKSSNGNLKRRAQEPSSSSSNLDGQKSDSEPVCKKRASSTPSPDKFKPPISTEKSFDRNLKRRAQQPSSSSSNLDGQKSDSEPVCKKRAPSNKNIERTQQLKPAFMYLPQKATIAAPQAKPTDVAPKPKLAISTDHGHRMDKPSHTTTKDKPLSSMKQGPRTASNSSTSCLNLNGQKSSSEPVFKKKAAPKKIDEQPPKPVSTVPVPKPELPLLRWQLSASLLRNRRLHKLKFSKGISKN